MAKGRMVWLARVSRGEYWLYSRKPRLVNLSSYNGQREPQWVSGGAGLRWFCPEEFERVTGYKLNPGECKRVRIRVEEQ